jgi:hypothetical protein
VSVGPYLISSQAASLSIGARIAGIFGKKKGGCSFRSSASDAQMRASHCLYESVLM